MKIQTTLDTDKKKIPVNVICYYLGPVEVVYLNTAHTNRVKPTMNNDKKQFKCNNSSI